ncbi:2,3-diketo-L-gulonate TRAP transporter small permease protein YiaM [Alloiococcus otitis]|uniref:Tripartite ATP-independent periplasmic transporters DctQ component domain-containing protein n=2 Tax=Alloiococcus TaxID=1651 RepID=K9EXH8_9LACT|nr:TRAP transporter small permease [Alloiococcus otitis]EKU93895.1 hypothetical protein HMPREF9698_00572 [Alloiococcus otitis ATCC 51267]SUU81700.1 2,3-diketo-L-gulonate TRAP transporter small permease protein YiaM [Alloiococcus otitis]
MGSAILSLKRYAQNLLGYIAAILLSGMAILTIYQVFMRYVMNNPSDWTQELIRYVMIWTGFIGAAYVFGTREHMSLTILQNYLKSNQNKWLSVLIDLVCLIVVFLVLVVGGFQISLSVTGVRSPILAIPRSLVYGVGPISGILISIIQCANIYEDIVLNQSSGEDN